MTNLRALERMAQIVYGDASVYCYHDNLIEIMAHEGQTVVCRNVTIQQAVAHLIDANQRQQVAFNEALKELGESK